MENSNKTTELVAVPNYKNLKGINSYKKAAKHLQIAANHHLDAAKLHEDGFHQKGAQSTLMAFGHLNHAKKAQKKGVKHLIV